MQTQFVVIEDPEVRDNQFLGRVALVNEDGTPWTPDGDSSAPSWSDITDKPSTFTPASHTHGIEDVDGLQAIIDDLESRVAALESGGVDG